MAVSRRSGDEIHPWLLNGDLRPEGVVREFQRERLVLNRTANLRRSDREGLPLTAAKVELSMTDLVRQAITLAVLNCAAR